MTRAFPQAGRIDPSAIILHPEELVVGQHARIEAFCFIAAPVEMAPYAVIQPGVRVLGEERLILEWGAVLGCNSVVLTTLARPDWHMSDALPPSLKELEHGRVRIEAEAFIEPNVLLLPGVLVGRGAIVRAGSRVERDVPPWTILHPNGSLTPRPYEGVREPKYHRL